jgi:tRNA G10  N-methylase Trm11
MIGEAYIKHGDMVLEPSCGCGRIMDAVKKQGAECIGFEIHAGRANEARQKGHNVIIGNFLESVPTGDFDKVIMNPPFYGKHYYKHIDHAMKFLKERGVLVAVLPITARYDHDLIKGGIWYDLPVGSFRESGTNVNTTILILRK